MPSRPPRRMVERPPPPAPPAAVTCPHTPAAAAPRLGLALALGLCASVAGAAPLDEDLAFAVRRYGLRDGLPQISVTDVVTGPDHRLWITTFGGIAAYDGVEFSRVDMAVEPALPSNRFVSAARATDGVLWFGTENAGLVKRLPDGRFEAVPLPAPLSDRIVWDLSADPRGGVWAAAELGVAYVSPAGLIEAYAVPAEPGGGQAVSVAPTREGLLVGTSTGVLRLEDGALRPTTLGGEDPGPTWALGEDRSGAIWGGGMNQLWRATERGLERWSNRAWNLRFAEDGAGGSWWHDADGLLHISADGAVERAQIEGLIAENRALHVDFEGNLWLGSGTRGLFHLEPRRMARLAAPAAGETPSVLPVAEARDGAIWTGGACGPLTRWGPDGPTNIPLPGLDGTVATAPCFQELLPTPEGGLWALSEDAIWWVDASAPAPTARLALALPVEDARVRTAALSPAGALVISRAGMELEVAEPGPSGALHLRPIGRPELPRPRSGLIFAWDGEGNLWAAAEGELLCLPAAGGPPRRWTTADGLPRGLPRALRLTGPGELWLGTYGGGLAHLRDGALRRVSTLQGLVENIVSQVIIDADGGMWLNGNRGISWVPAGEAHAFRTGESNEMHAILYAEGEGNGGSMSAGGRTRGGRVLLPTVDGLRVVRPEGPAPATAMAPVVFSAVEAGGQALPVVDGAARVPAGSGDLSIRFRALSFRSTDRLHFRHRLSGWERRWVEVGTSRSARYTNLPPGRYTLQLQTQGTDGVWRDVEASLAVVVLPAWHQRPEPRALAAAAAALAIGLAWWGRTRALRRKNDDLLVELDAQRAADAETRSREQRYRAVFEHAHNGFLLQRRDGALLDLNQTAARLLGGGPDALRAAPALSFIEPEGHAAWRAMLAAATATTPATAEVWARRGVDGAAAARFLLRAEARQHALPAEQAILVSLEDRSEALAREEERARMQRTVEQAGRLDAVGRLAGGVAHDFNNELTAILLQVDALRGEVSGPAAVRSLRALESSARRAAEITRSLLSFARGQLLEPRPVELHATIASMSTALSGFAVGTGDRRLRLPTADGEVWVLADPTQLGQVILNLVINAFDAIPGVGTVELRARALAIGPGDPLLPPGQAPGDYGVLEVIDDGVGMSAEVQARAFEPFFTTKPQGKGTGLGLAQVHGITTQSGGFLRLDTAPGAGCAVRVYLPQATVAHRARAAPAPRREVAGDRSGAGLQVLLCDDNPAVLRAAEQALTRGGFAVSAFDCPLEALRALSASAPGRWALLLTDVRMPAMDGPSLARAAAQLHPELRVLFMSGYAEVKLEDADLGWMLAKPFTPRALIDKVWARLDAPARAPDPAAQL